MEAFLLVNPVSTFHQTRKLTPLPFSYHAIHIRHIESQFDIERKTGVAL